MHALTAHYAPGYLIARNCKLVAATPVATGLVYLALLLHPPLSPPLIRTYNVARVSSNTTVSRVRHQPLYNRAQDQNEKVLQSVMEGRRGIDRVSLGEKRLTMLSVLESLATRTPSEASTQRTTPDQVQNTRRILGMTIPSFTMQMGRCPHGGKTTTDQRGVSVDVSAPVVELNIEEGQRGDIQSALKKLPTAGRRRCLFCESPERQSPEQRETGFVFNWDQGRPSMFFVSLPGLGLISEVSMTQGMLHALIVKLFGDEYALCGVTYSQRSGGTYQFSAQISWEGCWWTYRDLDERRVRWGGVFDDEFLSGRENMLMYIRADLVGRRYGQQWAQRLYSFHPVEEREVRSDSIFAPMHNVTLKRSPTSSALKRPNVCLRSLKENFDSVHTD